MTDHHNHDNRIKQTITRLQQPIGSLKILLSLLTAPLDDLGILPPVFRKYNTDPLSAHSVDVRKHIPLIQHALLDHIHPTWNTVLHDHTPDATLLLWHYFCPDTFVNALPVSGCLALISYETLLARRLGRDEIHLFQKLAQDYPIDRLWTAVFEEKSILTERGGNTVQGLKKELIWEDCVRDVVSVPAKVANAVGAAGEDVDVDVDVPFALENGVYLNGVCRRIEVLVERMSQRPVGGAFFLMNLINR